MFIGTIIVSILFGFLSTARPLLIQYAFDHYILTYDTDGLLHIILFIVLLLLLEAFFNFIFIYRSNFLAQKIIKIIRSEVFSKILSFKVKYFDSIPTGQLITRVISDMESIASIFSQGLLVVFGDIFKMIVIIICMFFVNWELAFISLTFLPFLVLSTIFFQRYMQSAFIDVRRYISKMNIFLYEHIIGMNIIQIFGKEAHELKLFKTINSLHRDAHIKTVLYFSIFLPIVDVFSAIAMGLLVWYGATQAVTQNNITIGEIIAFILFINMLFRPLRGIADRFNVLQMGMVAANRVFKTLNETNSLEFISEDVRSNKIINGEIIFKNVSFSYKEKEPVLKDINLQIKANETLAIIGPTGSGKTTIINLLMKWYDILEGDIIINNQNIRDISIKDLRTSIGVVLQDNFFIADTLMQNIKFFNKVSDAEVYAAVDKIGLKDFINKFPNRYDYYVGERGSGLSEGEKQLISFLRTYLLNPSYLILDEATSSMDPSTEILIQKSIRNITKERTSIIIAHRLSTIKYADKIVVLERGKIMESGNHLELINLNGKYSNYYYQQFIKN